MAVRPRLSYRAHIDRWVECVTELLFPTHLRLLEVQLLCMTSKQMRRALDKRRSIVETWMRALGTARKAPRLSTILNARNLVHKDGGRHSADCLYSFPFEISLAIQQSCIYCADHGYHDRRHPKTDEPFFGYGTPRVPCDIKRMELELDDDRTLKVIVCKHCSSFPRLRG